MECLSSSINRPKLAAPTLELKNNYYVVPNADSFSYFPIKIVESTMDQPIMRFEKHPPVLIDGIVIVKKKLYEVTAQDIFRGVIRKSREINTDKRDTDGSARTNTTPTSDDNLNTEKREGCTVETTKASKPTVLHPKQCRAERSAGMEIDENANKAWTDQIDTLLDFISSKEGEEWEVTDIAQP